MPIPLHLLVAAAKTLSDPNTIKTVKSIYDAGTGLIDKAQGLRGPSAQPPKAVEARPSAAPIAPAKSQKGLKADLAKRWMLKPGACGDLIRFRYTDDHGLVSVRTVGNWTSNGREISGYCLNLRAEHKFAISRIEAPEAIG